jgi:2-dehydro-3-deoxygluconokinase
VTSRPGVDVLCVGETMAMVTPQDGAPLAAGAPLVLAAGGAESNVAAWLAPLGHRAAWASRLGDDPLGRIVRDLTRDAGVDTSLVELTDRPTGLYVKAPGPDGTAVLYYRAGSAASTMDPGFAARLAAVAPRVLHLSGITPALSPGCRDLVRHLVHDRPLGPAVISFDVNHRPGLWSAAEARDELAALAQAADVVFVGLDEAHRLWGCGTAEEVRAVLDGPPTVVVKDGAVEAVSFTADGATRVPARRVDVVEPVGAGDAFAAGWLSGMLDDRDAWERLALGHLVAAAALGSATDHAALPTRAQIRLELDHRRAASRGTSGPPRPGDDHG